MRFGIVIADQAIRAKRPLFEAQYLRGCQEFRDRRWPATVEAGAAVVRGGSRR
jgi:hypothetical protein